MTENRPKTLERCPVMDGDEMEPNRTITIVPGPNEELLTEKEHLDYYEYRKAFLTWLLKFGKDPRKAKGYSPYTVYATGYRSANLLRDAVSKSEVAGLID